MKAIKFGVGLYATILLALLLFPPWTELPGERIYGRDLDPSLSSLGRHWRFALPYHWGWEEGACVYNDVPARSGCSVWEADRDAVVDFRALEYDGVIGLVVSILIALIGAPLIRISVRTGPRLRRWSAGFARVARRPSEPRQTIDGGRRIFLALRLACEALLGVLLLFNFAGFLFRLPLLGLRLGSIVELLVGIGLAADALRLRGILNRIDATVEAPLG